MIAEGLIGRDGNRLVRSPDALGTTAESAAIRTVISRDEVIHPIDLIHVMSLAHSIALGYNRAFRLLDRTTHIRFQFRTLHLAVAMNGIDLPIIVEKHREVVDTSLHVVMLPRSGITLQTFAIDVGKHIELSVGIADGWCPDALSVNLLMVLQ